MSAQFSLRIKISAVFLLIVLALASCNSDCPSTDEKGVKVVLRKIANSNIVKVIIDGEELDFNVSSNDEPSEVSTKLEKFLNFGLQGAINWTPGVSQVIETMRACKRCVVKEENCKSKFSIKKFLKEEALGIVSRFTTGRDWIGVIKGVKKCLPCKDSCKKNLAYLEENKPEGVTAVAIDGQECELLPGASDAAAIIAAGFEEKYWVNGKLFVQAGDVNGDGFFNSRDVAAVSSGVALTCPLAASAELTSTADSTRLTVDHVLFAFMSRSIVPCNKESADELAAAVQRIYSRSLTAFSPVPTNTVSNFQPTLAPIITGYATRSAAVTPYK